MNGLKTVFAGSAALLLAATGAQAQTQDLSEQEVQTFLSDAEQSITEAVRGGDFAKILDWTKGRIADDTTFTVGLELFTGEERKGFTSLTLTKEDMVKLGGISAGVLSGMQKGAIEDYSLEIKMTGFTPIGPNAAMVKTQMTERGRIAFPQTADASAAGKDSTPVDTGPRALAGRAAEIEGTAQCSHIVQRNEGMKELQLGLTSCQAEARIAME